MLRASLDALGLNPAPSLKILCYLHIQMPRAPCETNLTVDLEQLNTLEDRVWVNRNKCHVVYVLNYCFHKSYKSFLPKTRVV